MLCCGRTGADFLARAWYCLYYQKQDDLICGLARYPIFILLALCLLSAPMCLVNFQTLTQRLADVLDNVCAYMDELLHLECHLRIIYTFVAINTDEYACCCVRLA